MRFDALSPLQVAVATASLEIAVSAEGEALRADLLRNVIGLRAALQSTGQHCLGAPAPIVPVWTGSEAAARVAAAWLAHEAVLVQPVEFPGVPAGTARLCLHVMARHAPAPLQRAAHLVASACARAGAGGRTPRLRPAALSWLRVCCGQADCRCWPGRQRGRIRLLPDCFLP